MTDFERAIRVVSRNTQIPIDEVKEVLQYVFKFTIDVMQDDTDTRDILFHKLFKFKLKPRFKENKSINYSPKL